MFGANQCLQPRSKHREVESKLLSVVVIVTYRSTYKTAERRAGREEGREKREEGREKDKDTPPRNGTQLCVAQLLGIATNHRVLEEAHRAQSHLTTHFAVSQIGNGIDCREGRCTIDRHLLRQATTNTSSDRWWMIDDELVLLLLHFSKRTPLFHWLNLFLGCIWSPPSVMPLFWKPKLVSMYCWSLAMQ